MVLRIDDTTFLQIRKEAVELQQVCSYHSFLHVCDDEVPGQVSPQADIQLQDLGAEHSNGGAINCTKETAGETVAEVFFCWGNDACLRASVDKKNPRALAVPKEKARCGCSIRDGRPQPFYRPDPFPDGQSVPLGGVGGPREDDW